MNYAWDSNSRTLDNLDNSTSNIGSGKTNTELMVSQEGGFEAANACNEYEYNGYSDWFFASRADLQALRTFLTTNSTKFPDFFATFISEPYFSSSQNDSAAYYSYIKGSGNSDGSDGTKNEVRNVRPIRLFTESAE